MKRAAELVLLGLIAVGLTACAGSSARPQTDLEEQAERGLAVVIDHALPKLQQILRTHSSIDEISSDELLGAFVNDFTDIDRTDSNEILFNDAQRRAVYELDEIDGTVRFHAFFGSTANGSAGPVSSSAHRYTCGTISGSFGSDVIAVSDEPCQPALQEWIDAPMDEVSMVNISRRFDLDVGLSE